MLLNIQIPANTLIVQEMIFEVVKFDIVDLDFINNYLEEKFVIEEKPSNYYMSPNILEHGYDQTNSILNLVFPILLFAFMIVSGLLTWLLHLCFMKLYVVRSKIDWVKNKIYWNPPIRVFIEEYLVIAMACIIKLYVLDFSDSF